MVQPFPPVNLTPGWKPFMSHPDLWGRQHSQVWNILSPGPKEWVLALYFLSCDGVCKMQSFVLYFGRDDMICPRPLDPCKLHRTPPLGGLHILVHPAKSAGYHWYNKSKTYSAKYLDSLGSSNYIMTTWESDHRPGARP